MPTGGARPGAGRKPKAEKYERPINRAEKQIVDRLPDIVAAQIKLATGAVMSIEQRREKGLSDDESFDIYAIPPDARAGQYLINRILGRPTEHHELSGPDGGPIEFDGLSDAERAARATALLELARTRRAGQPASGSESN